MPHPLLPPKVSPLTRTLQHSRAGGANLARGWLESQGKAESDRIAISIVKGQCMSQGIRPSEEGPAKCMSPTLDPTQEGPANR